MIAKLADPEEVRNDRAVKVPKKELTELWKELMEDPYFRTSPVNGEEEEDNEKNVETQPKSKDKEKDTLFRSKEKPISSSEESSDGKGEGIDILSSSAILKRKAMHS